MEGSRQREGWVIVRERVKEREVDGKIGVGSVGRGWRSRLIGRCKEKSRRYFQRG
jgi:hypothetical protein